MSYPLDLDEYEEGRLRAELELRETRRASGACDYCGRRPDTSPCKFPERHAGGEPPTHLTVRLTLDEAEQLRRLLGVSPTPKDGLLRLRRILGA